MKTCGVFDGGDGVGEDGGGGGAGGEVGAEVVAMDSMTLYRGLDVGTAKPSEEERRGVRHHLIDVLEPWEGASVAEYRRWAVEAAEEVEGGGSGCCLWGGRRFI